MTNKQKEIDGETSQKLRLHRLRDITIHHLGVHATIGQIEALEYDIRVWVKNLLLTLDELNATADVQFIGETNAYGQEND